MIPEENITPPTANEPVTPPAAEEAAPKDVAPKDDKPAAAPAKGKRGGRSGHGSHQGGRGGGEKKGERGRNRRGRRGEGEEKEFQEEVLEVARVTRVVKGGRRLRFRATVVIGNRKGKVGLGTGKSAEVAVAVQKAVAAAKKQLITVPMENGTIPHELSWKHKAARILLMPARPGTGIIAGGAVRKIADLAGIENILGKTYGTSNPLVNAQAMMEALQAFPWE